MSPRRHIRRAAGVLQRRLWGRRLRQASSLAQLSALSGGDLAVHARHLGTGQTLSHGADQPAKLASIVKVPLAIHVLAEIEVGRFGLSDLVPVEPRHLCPGSGVIANRLHVPGLSLSIGNLLRLSLAESDNTATDVLFGLIGSPAAVQQAVAEWGHGVVHIDRTIRVMIGDLCGIQIEDGHNPKTVLRDAQPSGDHTRAFFADPLDTATPRAVVDLFADLWTGHLLPPDATAWLGSVLGAPATGSRRFRAGLPAGAVVAQKTGTLWCGAGRMIADAAVLRLPDGEHAAVAAFLTGSRQPKAEQEEVLARAADMAYHAFRQ